MFYVFECPSCGFFEPPEDYNDDPKTRKCPSCGGFEGGILYHGYRKSLPSVISDHLDDMVGQHDGKIYDSKSEYYKSLKENGLVVVEPGLFSDKKETRGDFNVRKELKDAYQELQAKGKI